ncbi:MAG TPA: ATP-grasp domain-containing protein [Clostridia bacterium]|nr:ATP-grasp domain-containing protein [Clostridia bacterium]
MEKESVPPRLKAGIAYNLKKGIVSDVEDIEAEYDSFDTIKAIKEAFEAAGANVVLLEADADFIYKLKKDPVDIVFNIAEGTTGRGREAQVPAILNFLGIPYSGSDETTLCISLDKALTKRYLSTYGIKTPSYQLVKTSDFTLDSSLTFPLIVKPNSEGSSKGISDLAIVDNEEQLHTLIEKNFRMYGTAMLIEEYIRGREFTVGVLGNGKNMRIFEPLEICYLKEGRENRIYSYNVKRNFKKYIEYKCPPLLPAEIIGRMKEVSAGIYEALDCRDFSRIDFRLSEDGQLYFIEINPLPGLAPGYSDYPMMAEFCGMDYQTLVLSVLNSALERYGLNKVALNRGGF